MMSRGKSEKMTKGFKSDENMQFKIERYTFNPNAPGRRKRKFPWGEGRKGIGLKYREGKETRGKDLTDQREW